MSKEQPTRRTLRTTRTACSSCLRLSVSSSSLTISLISLRVFCGLSSSNSAPLTQQMQEKKINIYSQMAQMLWFRPHWCDSSIWQRRDQIGGNKIKEAFFLSSLDFLPKTRSKRTHSECLSQPVPRQTTLTLGSQLNDSGWLWSGHRIQGEFTSRRVRYPIHKFCHS